MASIPHKEYRFLISVYPFLFGVMGHFMAVSWKNNSALLKLVLLINLIVNVALGVKHY
jgi:hypothetical protein